MVIQFLPIMYGDLPIGMLFNNDDIIQTDVGAFYSGHGVLLGAANIVTSAIM